MINQFSELGHILNDRSGLANTERLANHKLLLIATKAVMQQAAKGCPIKGRELRCEGLKPASIGAVKVHLGDGEPRRCRNIIHGEILLAVGLKEARVVAIEVREIELGHAASSGRVCGSSGCWRARRVGNWDVEEHKMEGDLEAYHWRDMNQGRDRPMVTFPWNRCRAVPLGPVGTRSGRWVHGRR